MEVFIKKVGDIMKTSIWNFWANKYSKLWVQKYSLRPTRNYIIHAISQSKYNQNISILDLGCGPGELIEELSNRFDNFNITGIDFSENMIEISKSKNIKANHILMDVAQLDKLEKLKNHFKIIICTHSLPYYKEPVKVLKNLYDLLENEGKIFIGFASGDSFYDKFVLSFVKLTTGHANYPSDEKFRQMVEGLFQIESFKVIKEKPYMPRIAVYTLRKVKK